MGPAAIFSKSKFKSTPSGTAGSSGVPKSFSNVSGNRLGLIASDRLRIASLGIQAETAAARTRNNRQIEEQQKIICEIRDLANQFISPRTGSICTTFPLADEFQMPVCLSAACNNSSTVASLTLNETRWSSDTPACSMALSSIFNSRFNWAASCSSNGPIGCFDTLSVYRLEAKSASADLVVLRSAGRCGEDMRS